MAVKGPRPYMDEALASLCSQGMGDDLEVIIQDGDLEQDAGLSDALNKGFAKAHGEWLFWLNADDILLPGTLKRIAQLIGVRSQGLGVSTNSSVLTPNSSLNWISGNTIYFTADGVFTDARYDSRWHGFLFRHLPVWSNGPSAFFRRDLWVRMGGFDTTLRFGMDIDIWTRWARAGERFVVMREPVWGFRWHEGSLTSCGRYAHEQQNEWRAWLKKMGFRSVAFWRIFLRLTQLFDGSYLMRLRLTAMWKGKRTAEVGA